MHIEKNVCDNILGTILAIEGKTKDGPKARAALKKRNIRKKQWQKPNDAGTEKVPHAPFLVKKDEQEPVFEWFGDVKYPHGYAGSLRNKVKVAEKKFYGMKTHDCHVLLQRLLPVVIRGFLPDSVVKPLIALCQWFQKLCARELKKEDVQQMEVEIVMILCSLEVIFPPHFFTIMIHLMVHLPEQVMLTGPVHYTWMYSMERQLGDYKKSMKNTRYPEGSIAEQYLSHETVTYCKSYLHREEQEGPDPPQWGISSFSQFITSFSIRDDIRLSEEKVLEAHWQVLMETDEAESYIVEHLDQYMKKYGQDFDEQHRRRSFKAFFSKWV